MAVSPKILKFLPRAHYGTRFLCAVFSQRSVEYRNFVVELDGIDCEPFVEVLALGKLDSEVHVAAAEGHLGDLLEVEVF